MRTVYSCAVPPGLVPEQIFSFHIIQLLVNVYKQAFFLKSRGTLLHYNGLRSDENVSTALMSNRFRPLTSQLSKFRKTSTIPNLDDMPGLFAFREAGNNEVSG